MMCVASFLEWHLGLLGACHLCIRYSEEEKMGGERIWSGAVGWSKLGEAIYSELDVSMPLPPPGL